MIMGSLTIPQFHTIVADRTSTSPLVTCRCSPLVSTGCEIWVFTMSLLHLFCVFGAVLGVTLALNDQNGTNNEGAFFENPIRLSGPDPSLVYVDGGYFLTYTSDTHIQMTRSRTLGGLYHGETRTFWTDTNSTRSAHMWAPEIHHIHDMWYVFYSSCRANDSTATCQTRVLQGCDGPNPYDCDYDWLADLVPPTGRQGGRFKNETFSIDGTYLEIDGQGYHVVSALDSGGIQAIQITALDTTAWTVSGWNIISRADQTVSISSRVPFSKIVLKSRTLKYECVNSGK